MAKSKLYLSYLFIIISVSLWGYSVLWTSMLIHAGESVMTFIFFRMLFAGIVLLLFSLLTKKLQKIDKKDFKLLILMVFCEPFIYFIGETYGIAATDSPTLSAVIIGTIPVFTLISGQLFFQEKLSKLNYAGIFITIPGIVLMVIDKGDFSARYWWGILLLFVAVLSAVGYSSSAKKLTEKYNSYTIATYQFLIGALFFLPLFLIFDAPTFSFNFFRWEVLYPLLSLAVLCSSLCFVLYIKSIKGLGITKTCVFTSLIPAVSAFCAYIGGTENMTPTWIIGIVIVVIGVILTQSNYHLRKKSLSLE